MSQGRATEHGEALLSEFPPGPDRRPLPRRPVPHDCAFRYLNTPCTTSTCTSFFSYVGSEDGAARSGVLTIYPTTRTGIAAGYPPGRYDTLWNPLYIYYLHRVDSKAEPFFLCTYDHCRAPSLARCATLGAPAELCAGRLLASAGSLQSAASGHRTPRPSARR